MIRIVTGRPYLVAARKSLAAVSKGKGKGPKK